MSDNDFVLTTPVVFIIFRRPDTTIQVFNRIRQARPQKLFVIAEGPGKPEDTEKCMACRKIIDTVDWPCEVYKNYVESDIGLKKRVETGLNWVFEHVEEAIILEDDCLPSLSFFRFCQEMLEKYRYDTRVVTVSGNNRDGTEKFDESYCFKLMGGGIWGWATWKRVWELHDPDMKLWPEFRKKNYLKILMKPKRYEELSRSFNLYSKRLTSWAYPFIFTLLINNGLGIVPKVNMIRNIGFRPDAEHTKDFLNKNVFYMDEELEFPLKHPKFMISLDRQTDPDDILPTSEEEVAEEFNERNIHFEKLLRENNHKAILDYFKDTLRNARSFQVPYAYYAAYAYFMLDDYEHAFYLIQILFNSGVISPNSFYLFVNAALAKNNIDAGFSILNAILSITKKIPAKSLEVIRDIVDSRNISLEKYPNIKSAVSLLPAPPPSGIA